MPQGETLRSSPLPGEIGSISPALLSGLKEQVFILPRIERTTATNHPSEKEAMERLTSATLETGEAIAITKEALEAGSEFTGLNPTQATDKIAGKLSATGWLRHSLDNANLTFQLARARGADLTEQAEIVLAAIWHDAGKHMPGQNQIFNSPDKLTPEENILQQTHPDDARYFLGKVPGMTASVKEIVRDHHEGGQLGYPRKLSQEEMPQGARELKVVDVYNALGEERSYKHALPENDRENRLLKGLEINNGDTEFDRPTVELFLRLKQEGKLQALNSELTEMCQLLKTQLGIDMSPYFLTKLLRDEQSATPAERLAIQVRPSRISVRHLAAA